MCIDFLIFLVWLFASAKQIHDAAERPAVDVEVRGQTSPCLWCAPLLEACASSDLVICVFEHHCDIEVDDVYLETSWASLESLPFLFVFNSLLLDQYVVRLQVPMADAVHVEVFHRLE